MTTHLPPSAARRTLVVAGSAVAVLFGVILVVYSSVFVVEGTIARPAVGGNLYLGGADGFLLAALFGMPGLASLLTGFYLIRSLRRGLTDSSVAVSALALGCVAPLMVLAVPYFTF